MSSTGNALGERLHEAAIYGLQEIMSSEEIERSLVSWKRIVNALVDFFANMGGENPIIFKCGDSVLTIDVNAITATHNQSQHVIDSVKIKAAVGTSEHTIMEGSITAKNGQAIHVVDATGIDAKIGASEIRVEMTKVEIVQTSSTVTVTDNLISMS